MTGFSASSRPKSVTDRRSAGCWLVACATILLSNLTATTASDRPHPFLFVTQADVERARDGIKHNKAFAQLARELTTRATTNRIEDLPPLETNWWRTAKQKPWANTYPEIFHHTWVRPLKYAGLARDCARASLVSPSPELVARGKRTLLTLSDYTFEFEHYDVGMNYTIWMTAALDAYDILHRQFDTAERARLDAFCERYLAALRKNDDYWIEHEPGGKLNNHYAWHKLGLAMMGVFYNRPELVDRALRGPKGVEYMLANGFKDDGLWLEGSIPYQFAETTPLLLLAQMLENARWPESLFNYRAANGRTLKQSYDALIPLLFPDRTLPTIGDCYARRPHIGDNPDWEILFRQFRDPAYSWLIADWGRRTPPALFSGIPSLPHGSPPAQVSRVWPEMGYVALRSNEGRDYWSGKGWSLFATFSGQPVHENADKLSFILFANGHLWLPDCEAKPSAEHAFSSATQGQLNRSTVCHNTLVVDNRSQRFAGVRLDLIEFTNAPGLKRVTIADLHGRLYDSVRQSRTLIVTPDYVLDFFQVSSAQPHDFTWLTHVDGQRVAGSVAGTTPVKLPVEAPWSYLREAKGAGSTNNFWECFTDGKSRLRLDMLTDGSAEITHCGFPRDDSSSPETIPMRMVHRHGTNAWFLALYQIGKRPEKPSRLKMETGPDGKVEMSAKLGRKTILHELPQLDVLSAQK